MGGDDLASDDEYLFESGTATSSKSEERITVSSEDDAEISGVASSASKKKRKQISDGDPAEPSRNGATADPSSSSKKRSKPIDGSKASLLIHAGRGIALDGPSEQAVFFSTCYSHAVKISTTADVSSQQSKVGDDDAKGVANPEQFAFQPCHFHSSRVLNACNAKDQRHHDHSNLQNYIKESNVIPSMTRLKNWKYHNSPMVLIITLSARRSVELLQQLSFLKLPVAKLFAKHMSVDTQADMLGGRLAKDGDGKSNGKKAAGKCYGIGVGTPGRMLALLQHGRRGDGEPGALRLNHTEVIIIDCHEDSKGFTVCTMKDTVPELMEFMKQGVVLQLEKRQEHIKLALF